MPRLFGNIPSIRSRKLQARYGAEMNHKVHLFQKNFRLQLIPSKFKATVWLSGAEMLSWRDEACVCSALGCIVKITRTAVSLSLHMRHPPQAKTAFHPPKAMHYWWPCQRETLTHTLFPTVTPAYARVGVCVCVCVLTGVSDSLSD